VFKGYHRWRTGIAACVLVCVTRSGVAEQGVQGTVLDIQGRVVVGASVTIACPAVVVRIRTDARGQFVAVRTRDATACWLSVAQPGFTPITEPPGSWTSPARIELHLAPVREYIDVTAKGGDPSVQIASAQSDVVSATELKTVGNRAADWLRYARLKAGATGGDGQVLVDGVPAATLPPTAAIANIAINADPFSAEYVAPNENQVDITTHGPERAFHWSVGGSSLGFGGQNPLLPDQSSTTRSANIDVSSGLPLTPVVFLAEAVGNRQSLPVPVRGLSAPDQSLGDIGAASTRSTFQSVSALLFYSAPQGLELRGSYQQSDSSSWQADVGGVTEPTAASNSLSAQREARLTLQQREGNYRIRGGLTFADSSRGMTGLFNGPMISVPGSLATGAAALSSESTSRVWTVKGVLEQLNNSRPWSAGVIADQTINTLDEHPNPFGTLLFPNLLAYAQALGGAHTGSGFVDTGNGQIRTTTLDVSAFFQGDLVRRANGRLRAGLRTDYQSRDGVRFSPRLSGTTRMLGFAWAGGVGTFTKNWPSEIFAKVLIRDDSHLVEQVENGVGLSTEPNVLPTSPAAESGSPLAPIIVSRVDAAFRRRRDTIGRISIQRQFRKFDSTLEYTLTNASNLPGMRRLPAKSGWIDDLSSDYHLRAHQLHVRAQYVQGEFALTAHYEWTHSRDSSGGPFAIEPAGTPPLWAASGGVSPHQASLVATARIKGALSFSVVGSATTGAPYDIFFARDVAGDALFADRNGLPRNSGIGPAFRTLDLYAAKQIELPSRIVSLHGPRAIHIGVQANNVLGWQNNLSLGAVMGTPLFGQPLGALQGRVLRLWVTM
jgi:hypothetical protein